MVYECIISKEGLKMLTSLRKLSQYTLRTVDREEIGQLACFLFDSSIWLLKYVLIEMEPPFVERRVQVSVDCLGRPNQKKLILPIMLTTAEIETCDDAEATMSEEYFEGEQPLDSSHWLPELQEDEDELPFGDSLVDESIAVSSSEELEQFERPELSNTDDVLSKFRIQGYDGEIGRIEDLVVDDYCWFIRYFIVSLRDRPDCLVTVSTDWIEYADMVNGDVFIDLSTDVVSSCPEYKETMGMQPNYEKKVQMHYDQSKHSRRIKQKGAK